ncbi:MAG: trifunctional transcriptional regulator/proline dehydrogenase/L-glutamate gamma-semialdehyde dehydrogenase, partial [Pseudomonadota bacterium]
MPLPHQKEHGTADERSNSSSLDRTNAGETKSDADRREAIRSATLQSENSLLPRLIDIAALNSDVRLRAQEDAAAFIKTARASASRSSLIDKFLLEYGLSTTEGVTLMRLAEALLRTPDATTADALIKDKLEAGDWKAHAG